MSKRRIKLTTILIAEYAGEDDVPIEATSATEEIVVEMPSMDAKLVEIPKIQKGATERVILEHRNKVDTWYSTQAKEEQRRKEYEQMDTWNGDDVRPGPQTVYPHVNGYLEDGDEEDELEPVEIID